jgi:A/G-specific adenine glycosylase
MFQKFVQVPSKAEIKKFRSKISHWFTKNDRDYPWRKTNDPFKVLIAEMMLRRTKADQVKRVYEEFFKKYNNMDVISKAKKEEMEKILAPLGLNWRTPAFSSVVREIKEKYNGKVPETRDELLTLPGVGDYVAGAVLSISQGKREWIVDSNIVRVFKRYFGIEISKEGRRDKHVIAIAKRYVDGRDPRTANLAILDFAALVCTPRNPKHSDCTLRSSCHYFNSMNSTSDIKILQ